MWRGLLRRPVLGIALAVAALAVPASPAFASPDEPAPDEQGEDQGEEQGEEPDGDTGTVTGGETGDTVPVTLPLIPVPTGCTPPPAPHIVFVGEVIDRDVRSIRYRITTIRSGRPDPFAGNGRIDVRYGLDAQYLQDGEEYLVSAVVDPDLGVLASRVTEPIEHFGGDEVIGISESDVRCPVYEDAMRTLHLDGTPVEGGVITPFLDAKFRILGAFLIPAGVAFGAIFVLASLRLSVSGIYRGLVRPERR